MSSSIKHLISQFNLHTKLFNSVTAGVDDEQAQEPLSEYNNHIAWLTGHTVSSRYMLANVLGLGLEEPFADLFENGMAIDDDVEYPSMEELTADWADLSVQTLAALEGLSEEALEAKLPRPVPTGDTLGDFIAFILHHEAYTIGQLGFARRFFGLEAMKYS